MKEKMKDGFKILTIDTSKVDYRGIAWRNLGDFGKLKFENRLVLSRPKERIRVIYV